MNSDKPNHWTELHTAAKNGDTEGLARLIQSGANLDAGVSMILPTRLRLFMPVHIAALEGHP